MVELCKPFENSPGFSSSCNENCGNPSAYNFGYVQSWLHHHERIFMTIELEITHFSKQINIPDEELEGILRVASWQIEPQFPYPGRTAWHILKNPIYLKKKE